LVDFLLGSVVECKERLFFLADEHEAVVIITFNISGEFDVGDEEVIVLILHGEIDTCSYLVLNHSLALPYLTGIIIKYCCIDHQVLFHQQNVHQKAGYGKVKENGRNGGLIGKVREG
jgi:hypothetical protein